MEARRAGPAPGDRPAGSRESEEAAELFRTIGRLERGALLRAGRPTALVLAGLEELDAALLDAPDARGRLDADRRWHHLLLPALRIGVAARGELDRLESWAAPYRERAWREGPDLADPVPIEEHRAVVDALFRHRVDEAARLLEAHWLDAAARAGGRPPSRDEGRAESPAAA